MNVEPCQRLSANARERPRWSITLDSADLRDQNNKPNLAAALSERQVVIHEEAVAEVLLKDLQTSTGTSQTLDPLPEQCPST